MPEWPKEALQQRLPNHVRITPSARFIELTCGRCGWLDVLIREKTTLEQVFQIAWAHRCPIEPER